MLEVVLSSSENTVTTEKRKMLIQSPNNNNNNVITMGERTWNSLLQPKGLLQCDPDNAN